MRTWIILHVIKLRKANWIGHILGRNCLLKQVTEERQKKEEKRWEDKEKDTNIYRMILRQPEDPGN
jgi:hypothetical protein